MAVPTDVATLSAWWKADSLGLTNGAAVSSWADSSGNGNTAAQATGTSQPSYQTNQANSLPVVRFDGTSDNLAAALSSSLAATTLFAVVKPNTSVGNRTIRGIGVAGSGGLQWRFSSGPQQLLKGTVAAVGSSSSTPSTTVFSVLTASFSNAATYAFYLNGTADGSGSHAQTLTAAQTTLIGDSGSTGGEFLSGDLAELIIYSSVLSAGDRATVHTYLSDRYAITVADYIATPDELRIPIQIIKV